MKHRVLFGTQNAILCAKADVCAPARVVTLCSNPRRLPRPCHPPAVRGARTISLPKWVPLFEKIVSENTGTYTRYHLPAALWGSIPPIRQNVPKNSNKEAEFGSERIRTIQCAPIRTPKRPCCTTTLPGARCLVTVGCSFRVVRGTWTARPGARGASRAPAGRSCPASR